MHSQCEIRGSARLTSRAMSRTIRAMNRTASLLLLGLLSFLGTSHARLGETLAQCEERYGPVVERVPATVSASEPEACKFSKNGITILIEYKNGVAWRLLFRKVEMAGPDVETLLIANLPDGGWSIATKVAGLDYRVSPDRQRVAVHTDNRGPGVIDTLEIATRSFAAANHADYAQRVGEAMSTIDARKKGIDLKGF